MPCQPLRQRDVFADGLRQRFVDQLAARGYLLAFGVILEAGFLHGVVVLGCIGHVLVDCIQRSQGPYRRQPRRAYASKPNVLWPW